MVDSPLPTITTTTTMTDKPAPPGSSNPATVALDLENEMTPAPHDAKVQEHNKDRHRQPNIRIETSTNALLNLVKDGHNQHQHHHHHHHQHAPQGDRFASIYDDCSSNEMESASEGNPIDSAIDDESSIAIDDSLDGSSVGSSDSPSSTSPSDTLAGSPSDSPVEIISADVAEEEMEAEKAAAAAAAAERVEVEKAAAEKVAADKAAAERAEAEREAAEKEAMERAAAERAAAEREAAEIAAAEWAAAAAEKEAAEKAAAEKAAVAAAKAAAAEKAAAEKAAEARRIDEEERLHMQEFERKMDFFKQSHLAPSDSVVDMPQFHDYAPCNATTVIKTVNFIVANHGRVKRLDVSAVVELQAILSRLLEAHERFQQICLCGNEEVTLKALYSLLTETKTDHHDLVVRWAATYHSIQEVGDMLAAKLQGSSGGHHVFNSGKTKLLSLFRSQKTAASEPLTADECEHWVDALGQAANDWRVMMDNMVPQWKAYKFYARQMHRFAIVVETESIGGLVDGFLRQTYKEARTIFRNSIKLAQLHHQIDYSALNKEVPKENTLDATSAAAAAAAAEEDQEWGSQHWQSQQQQPSGSEEGPDRHVFAYDVLKKRRHIYHGTLVEHQPSTQAVPSSQGSKKTLTSTAAAAAAMMVQPVHEMELILTTDLVYIGSRMAATDVSHGNGGGVGPAVSGAASPKTIKLLHEPVGLADTQITCPPDAPPANENVVIVCFHNTTTYILQAKSAQERDAWMRVARQYSLDRPRQTIEATPEGSGMTLNASTSTASLTPSLHITSGTASIGSGGGGNGGTGVRSLFQRFRSIRRTNGAGHPSLMGSLGDLAQGELGSSNKLSQRAGVDELGLRRLPADRGTIVPVPLHVHLRASVMVERQVQMVDLTTGRTALCEFGLARENYQVNDRVDAGFLMVTLPAAKATQEEYFAANGQGLVAAPYDLGEPTCYYHPLKPEDIFVSTWIHPGLDLQFEPEMVTVSLASMFKFIFDAPETVERLQHHYHKLLAEQIQAPDNLFLTMPFRSQAVQVAKRMSRGVTAMNGMHERLEMGRCYIEFRQMSNHPGALSVGFWNPKTRRDMSLGVCPLNLSQMNAPHTATTITAVSASTTPTSPNPVDHTGRWPMSATTKTPTTPATATTGAVKMQQLVTRDSPTELQFRLIQTDVVLKRQAQGGKMVMTARDSSSLDTYYIQGSREALNEFEEFLRRNLGVLCTARSIGETMQLAKLAFSEKALKSAAEDSERSRRVGSDRSSYRASVAYSVRTSVTIVNDEDASVGCESIQTSASDLPSQGHVAKLIKNLNLVNPGHSSCRSFTSKSSRTSLRGLATVVEEMEAQSNREGDSAKPRTRRATSATLDRASMGTTSFQFKSVDSLKRMANEVAADRDDAVKDSNQDADGFGGVLQIDSSSFGDLTTDSLLSSFFSSSEDVAKSNEEALAKEMDTPERETDATSVTMATAPSTSSGYVEVSAFKLCKSKNNLPASSSAMSSTLSIRNQQQQPLQQQQQQQQQPQQQQQHQQQQQRWRERGPGQGQSRSYSKGSSGSFYEPKSVADLARFWAETTSSSPKLHRLGASSHTMGNRKRSGSSVTLESPQLVFAAEQYLNHPHQPYQYQHQHQHQHHQSRQSISKALNESMTGLPNAAAVKGLELNLAAEARHVIAQSQSRQLRQSQPRLRQSQKWEGGVESVPHQPVRELRAHWESLRM
ncbi:hypothetical protein DFQ27_002137 [Actinomortierella ambigua]|uniref:PH domain-containing protein n=1 Tax=Actinomortierella ambigua TaxID=1343610 RepID=A0A9P6U7P2_9FUNG|nr:hypothetical protein DFQ27_002137 [Actinomortierella ambigua]